MKFFSLAVLLTSTAIGAVWLAYSSHRVTLASDNGVDSLVNLHIQAPISKRALTLIDQSTQETISPSFNDSITSCSSSTMRTKQGNTLFPDSITSTRSQLEMQKPCTSANHAVTQNPSKNHQGRQEVLPQSSSVGSRRKTFMNSGVAKGRNPIPPQQPAVWADPGDLADSNPDRDFAIQREAEQLVQKIANSALPTDSDEYRVLWDSSVADSDEFFRKRYGNWDWMVHHVQAHHLAATQQEEAP